MDDSAIVCDEVINGDKANSHDKINFNEKKAASRTQISIFYLHFY